jgi:hypothetical protein
VNQPAKESILSVPDSSSLTDYCSDYAVVREMKVVLANKEILLGLAIPAVLPRQLPAVVPNHLIRN